MLHLLPPWGWSLHKLFEILWQGRSVLFYSTPFFSSLFHSTLLFYSVLFFQSFIYISTDSRTFLSIFLYFGLYFNTSLWLKFVQPWLWLGALPFVSYLLLTYTITAGYLERNYSLFCCMMRYSRLICNFPAPVLESATSPKSPGLCLLEKSIRSGCLMCFLLWYYCF